MDNLELEKRINELEDALQAQKDGLIQVFAVTIATILNEIGDANGLADVIRDKTISRCNAAVNSGIRTDDMERDQAIRVAARDVATEFADHVRSVAADA